MKKTKISIISIILVLMLILAACGSSNSNAPSNSSNESGESEEAEETEEAEAEAEAEEEPVEEAEPASFEEMVLVDNEQCVMKITGVDPDDMWGYALKVYLENKTEGPIMFSVDECSVNGYMMDPFWAESVAAGKKSNSTITWFDTDFEENGIEKVEEIEMKLRVYDEEDWSKEAYVEDVFTITIP